MEVDIGALTVALRERARRDVDRTRAGAPARAGRGPRADAWTAPRVVLTAALIATLYGLGALLPFWYLKSPEAGSAFFPSAGITVAALILTPRRLWPVWLGVVAATELVIDVTHGVPIGRSIGFATANTMEPLVGALLFVTAIRRHPVNLRRRWTVYGSTAVVLGPVVGAAIATTVSVVAGTSVSWLRLATNWWLGDAIGVLVVATPILVWRVRQVFEVSPPAWELAAMFVAATAITIVPALLWDQPMMFAVLPVLMWAAFRGGTRAVTLAGVGVAFAADWAAVTGRASLLANGAEPSHVLAVVQCFLALTLIAGITLAVEIADRRRVEQQVRENEALRLVAELEAQESVEQARRQIARDTHDIVSHGVSVMLLQVGAARRMLERDPDATRTLLESAETVGRAACSDLDIALSVVRPSLEGDELGRGLANVATLIESLRGMGMDVDLEVRGEPLALPTLADRSAYRIIQESLTNAAKHAPGATVHVTVTHDDDTVILSVVDDGARQRPTAIAGHGRGLIGMRERAAALSGRVEAGPEGASGYAVRAWLPRDPTRR